MAIGFYDDFARFFLALKKALKQQNPNVSFYYLSTFVSGFLYFFVRGHCCSWLCIKAWTICVLKKKKYQQLLVQNPNIYKGISISYLYEYNAKLDSKNLEHYKLMALIYIDLAESFVNNHGITHLLTSGDSRIFCRAFIEVCKKHKNIKVLYFEQGAFGTTFMDTKGVNANSRFREICKNHSQSLKTENENTEAQLFNFMKRKRPQKYKRYPFYRGIDYLLNFIFIKFQFGPKEIIEKRTSPKPNTPVHATNTYNTPPVVFATQVPEDANMILHSPNFSSHSEILKFLINTLDDSNPLVIREHPLYKGRYEPEFYDLINKNKHVYIDNKTPLNSILQNSKLVVVNNSTVGIEALSLKKPVLVTGESYYDQVPGVIDIQTFAKQNSVEFNNFDTKSMYELLNLFFKDYLYTGHFRDDDLSFTQEIAKDILQGAVKSETVLGS